MASMAAEIVSATVLREIDEIDEQEAERSAAQEAADDPPARGIARQHRERPPVAITRLALVEVAEPFLDDAMRLVVRRIGDDYLRRCHGTNQVAQAGLVWRLLARPANKEGARMLSGTGRPISVTAVGARDSCDASSSAMPPCGCPT